MRRGRKPARSVKPLVPGEVGFRLLRYVGQAPTARVWKGPITGAWYVFGPGDERYVDDRDARIFLNPRGDGGAVFDDCNEGH